MTAEQIRTFRTNQGLTQQQLAEALGVSLSSVVRWESGKAGSPTGAARLLLERVMSAAATESVADAEPKDTLTAEELATTGSSTDSAAAAAIDSTDTEHAKWHYFVEGFLCLILVLLCGLLVFTLVADLRAH